MCLRILRSCAYWANLFGLLARAELPFKCQPAVARVRQPTDPTLQPRRIEPNITHRPEW